ncbi:MAG: chemotaxis protein CheC [Candidatus Hodarchaeales archaeon]|jgi:chemotaxis protein CheC
MEDSHISLEDFSPEHLDAIREIASVGCGHSATALSELLEHDIRMEVPDAKVVAMEEVVYELIKDEEKRNETVAGLFIETEDDYPMDVVILFDKKTLDLMFESMMLSDMTDLYNLTEFEKSLIIEVGNILILNFVSALEMFTLLKIRPRGSPYLTIDIAEALLNAIIIKSGVDVPSLLLIENRLYTEEQEVNVLSLLLPSEKVLNSLMKEMFS